MIPKFMKWLHCGFLALALVAAISANAAAPVAVEHKKLSDWGSGMICEFALTNSGTAPVKDWRLRFRLASQIQNIWGARILEHKDDTYLLGPEEWSRQIAGGSGRVVFGFQSNPGGVTGPEEILFQPLVAGNRPDDAPERTEANGVIQKPIFGGETDVKTSTATGAEIAFKVLTDWGSGFQAEVVIRNSTSEPIRNWTLQFTMPRRITALWNAHIASISGNTFLIDAANTPWNRDIPPGGEIRFGFIGAPGAVVGSPENMTLVPAPKSIAVPTALPTPSEPGVAIPQATPQPTPPAPARRPSYADVLAQSFLFYEAQRSGRLPEDNRVAWRGDSAMEDGFDVGEDLTGGYFDAGDGMKFGLPMAGSMTLLAWGGIEFPRGYQRSGQAGHLLSTVRWGTDWLMRAHPSPGVFYGQVGRGDLDHAFWGPPEAMEMERPSFRIDRNKPGSELAGEAAAALASASILFRKVDLFYSARCLEHARALFQFANEHRGKYSDSIPEARAYYNSFTGYHDELAWAAAWMYKASGEQAYLELAEKIYGDHLSSGDWVWTHSWDDKRYGAAILLAELTGKKRYLGDVEKWMDFWTIGRNGRRVQTTPGGLAWLDQWGSLRYAANTAFLALIASRLEGTPNTALYRTFAIRQINYILGDNPLQRSYVVGVGNNPPRNPHHRGAHGSTTNSIDDPVDNRHILFGALVGGPSAPDDFAYVDDRTNYITNEVALDYNAGFTGALAGLVELAPNAE